MRIGLLLISLILRVCSWRYYTYLSNGVLDCDAVFSPDDKAVIVSSFREMGLFYINQTGQDRVIDESGSGMDYINRCVLSKGEYVGKGYYVVYGGDGNGIFVTTYNEFLEGDNDYIVVLNDVIYDMDFSFDDNKILICGGTHVQIDGFFTRGLRRSFSIQNGQSSCQYSNYEDKFGWSDGKSFYVYNSNFTNFYNYTFGSYVRDIRFLKGSPYPIVLVTGIGIIKTAANTNDWQIINFVYGKYYRTMSISKDQKYIAIGSGDSFSFVIYSVQQFKPYVGYDTNILSVEHYHYRVSMSNYVLHIDFSNSGKNLVVTINDSVYGRLFSDCISAVGLYWDCTQPCGDGLVFVLDCDFEARYQLDGCQDNCTVQDDFECVTD